MQARLTPETETDEGSGVETYELPNWAAGQAMRAKSSGLLGGSLLLGGLMFGFPVVMIWISGQPADQLFAHCAAPVVIADLVASLLLLNYALRGAPARSQLEFTAQSLGVVTQIGLYRRCRPVAWSEIARFVVQPAWNAPGLASLERTFLLQAVRFRGQPVRIAGNENRDWLLNLADDLARRAKAARDAAPETLLQPGLAPLKVVEEISRDLVSERTRQPAHSRATFEEHVDGVTITLPPLGLGGCLAEHGPMAVLVIVTVSIGWVVVTGFLNVPRAGLFMWGSALSVGLAALVFIPNLVSSLIDQAKLSARDGVLTVEWTNLLGKQVRTWPREDLADICVVSERVSDEGGTVWTQYLSIRPHEFARRAPRKLLRWCEKPELEWIATTIRRALPLRGDNTNSKPARRRWDEELA
jgi:hypothetical protein